jgi:molecular chaperone Hsp33
MEKKKIFGSTPKERLLASAKDTLHQFILAGGALRGVLLHSTKMVNEMRANHELGIIETMILGYGYMSALLLSSNLKGAERLVLELNCDGPAQGMSVEANAFGEVRGYLKQRHIIVPGELKELDISPFIGNGLLSVTRYLENAKYPFTGRVKLEYKSFALNLAHYALQSEQIPSSYSLSIYFNKKAEVTGAGALLIQAMPGASDSLLAELEELVNKLPSLGKEYAEGLSAVAFMLAYFAKYNPQFLSRKRIIFMCHCSKERFKAFLSTLPGGELENIIESGPFPMELTCYNCNTQYRLTRQEVEALLLS